MSVENIISSGITPLELEYYSINSLEDNEHNQVGFRTVVRVNSPDLGVLYPEQYRTVLNRTSQCVKLTNWAFSRLINEADKFLKKFPEDFLLTLYVPARMISKPDLEKLLNTVQDDKKYILSHLVLEFSSDILFESSAQIAEKLAGLKNTFGIKLMMSQFGDEFCPVLKLGELPFDYIIIDKSLSDSQKITSINTQSVIQLINNYSMSCIFESTGKHDLLEEARESGCSYYCSNRKTVPAGAK